MHKSPLILIQKKLKLVVNRLDYNILDAFNRLEIKNKQIKDKVEKLQNNFFTQNDQKMRMYWVLFNKYNPNGTKQTEDITDFNQI